MKKIKLVKKRDEVSDAGDLKISIYKPEKGRSDISIVTVKRAIRLQSGSRWETGSYKNKEGQTIYTTDVIANNVEFLGSSQQSTLRQPDEAYSDSAPNYQEALPDGFEATEEDIPF